MSSYALPAIVHDVQKQLAPYVQLDDANFLYAILIIVLCPTIWNTVARTLRYFTHDVYPNVSMPTRFYLCYAMTVWIFFFSTYRDYLVHRVMSEQPEHPVLKQHSSLLHPLAYVLLGFGQLFVLSSFYQLGITGTFLGDYVGILMAAPVTSFPFSVLSNPMYTGSTMCFLGTSLLFNSVVGLILTAVIFVVYQIALAFEGPYTTMIYQQRDQEHQQIKKKKK